MDEKELVSVARAAKKTFIVRPSLPLTTALCPAGATPAMGHREFADLGRERAGVEPEESLPKGDR
jgi:hypothetical protein